MRSEALGGPLAAGADPGLAGLAVARVGERPAARAFLERPHVLEAAARLFGISISAADFFLAHPEELGALADLRLRSRDELLEEAARDVERFQPVPGLRRFRRRATYRVAARDLGGDSVERVTAELSDVAEACLTCGARTVGGGLAVIAMGKLGGRELNYASDVDVLFVHGEAGGAAQESASRDAARLIALLSEPTADGVALRMDPNLRPEGRRGPLSRSIHSMLEYYERHAETWERQALLKARPVAGDLALGERFVASIVPLVYPAVLPAAAIEDVRSTKARIEERVRALGKDEVELKRGRGGIRDVEFAVQLLQLVHGRRHERLRKAGTLAALAALAHEGFVAPDDAEALAASYRFLRRLEHRLQMVREAQTHELPSDHHALGTLARSMGLPDAARLRAEHARHVDAVRGLHERLFYRPLLEAFAGAAPPRPGADRPATEELLRALGFTDPSSAYVAFERVVEPSSRLGTVLGGLFPIVAPALAFAPAPDAALRRFESVTGRFRDDQDVAHLLADRPDAARRLATLVATSSAFADALVARPGLVRALLAVPPPERAMFAGDPQAELIRVAGAFASGELLVPDLGTRLSAVADGVIGQSLADSAPGLPMAVFGLGRLGAEELSFASDLDVLFVYDGEGPRAFEEACRAAERTLEGIRRAGWQADPDLRPEGRSGPLARSVASYLEYWERWAAPWEYQSLLRARRVAGDESLGHRFSSSAADFAYPETLTLERLAAVRRMRVRIEEERIRSREARRLHFKLGYGSLADVQFATELGLMRHGFAHPQVRGTRTLEALDALVSIGVMEGGVGGSLADAHLFLSTIKAWLELERRLPQDALPSTPEGQAALGRLLGYGESARSRFLQDYRRVTRRARLAMERVFYGDEP